jgi:hypothetical protein
MKSIYVLLGACAAVSFVVACSDDAAPKVEVLPSTPGNDAGVDAQTPVVDSGTPDASEVDAGRQPPVFLTQADYADYIAIDPAFPFDVTQVHTSDAPVDDARWGRGGPMVTTLISAKPVVVRYVVPAAPKAPLTYTTINYVEATGLPAQKFFGGMIDLPVGQKSLLSYTGSGAAFPGEVLLYSTSLLAVEGRANVNGYFGGVGVQNGAETRYVYSALSAFAAAPSGTSSNGLYVSDSCSGALAPSGTCKPGFALVQWTGASGPVTTDAQNNVFVAASLSGGPASDGIYGFTRAEVLGATATLTRAPLFSSNTGGTASVAAVAPEGTGEGWVLAKGYDFPAATTVAFSYGAAGTVTDGSKKVDAAIKPGAKMNGEGAGYTLFTDPEGDLWVAAVTNSGSALLELRRKP